jgi:hypothetical protein
MPPLTLTRRIGAACETAQKSVLAWQPLPPATSMVRLESDRQKLSSAVQFVVPGVVGAGTGCRRRPCR